MDKRIDESWKEQVEKEKGMARQPDAGPSPPRGASAAEEGPAGGIPSGRGPRRSNAPPAGEFSMFLSSISMQALMALGEIPHPVTQTTQEDLEQARYLIDVLGILQAKTKGNLTPEESALMEDLLYELRMKYVAKTGGPAR